MESSRSCEHPKDVATASVDRSVADTSTNDRVSVDAHKTSQKIQPEGPDKAAQNATKVELPVLPKWSERLATNTTDPTCSPCIELGKNEDRNGLGLQLAVDRARKLTRGGRRGVNLLIDATTLYDQYAQALLKAGRTLPSMLGNRTRITRSSSTVSSSSNSISNLSSSTLSIQESIVSWSGELSKLSVNLRSAIATPLQVFLGTHGETVTGLEQRYSQSRQKCFQIRQRALMAQGKYRKAIKDAEQAIEEWRSKSKGEDTATISADPKPPKRVVAKLKEFQYREAKYKKLVNWENECVIQCEKLESMALESLQKLEEDRLLIFVHSLRRVLLANADALNETNIGLKEAITEEGVTETLVHEKKEKLSFSSILKPSSYLDEGSGVMDAETLGLPGEIGKLRDQSRSVLAARSSHFQAVRALSMFLENVAAASETLGVSLKQHIRKSDSKSSTKTLTDALESCEGPGTFHLWNIVIQTLDFEAESALKLAKALRRLRSEKLDRVILDGEKATKFASDMDDLQWKQICEAARSQSKAENRYRSTSTQTAKARDRVKSVGSGDHGSDTTPQKVSDQVSKSLANMFSILPDGGDQAMKFISPNARFDVAHRSLADADVKEHKDKQNLNLAVENTARVIDMYKKSTGAFVEQNLESESATWENVSDTLRGFVSEVDSVRLSRLADLQEQEVIPEMGVLYVVQADTLQWIAKLEIDISTKIQDPVLSNSISMYKLEAQLESSDSIRSFVSEDEAVGEAASINEDEDDEVPDDVSEGETFDSATNKSKDPPTRDRLSSFASLDIENQAAKWMRSLAVPASPYKVEKGGAGPLSLGGLMGRHRYYGSMDTETEVFVSYFWPGAVDSKSTPVVIASYQCSFRDSSQRLPFQYGRVFVTELMLLFVSWTGRKLALNWVDIRAIEPISNFLNTSNDTLLVTCKTNTSGESYMFLGSFFSREESLDAFQDGLTRARLAEEAKLLKAKADIVTFGNGTVAVPQDETLQKMEVVLSRHLRNVSIQRFYDIVWSEGAKTDDAPFYGPWLRQESLDVELGEWIFEDKIGPWCKESYPQSRAIAFRVKRRTHLYIGPPIANVAQTHFCRLESNDKCVVEMRVEFDGIPYSDCFAVEVRWVARRVGVADILVEVGVFVDFKKSTFLKSKIRSGTLEETTSVHQNLFEAVQAACIAAGGQAAEEDVSEELSNDTVEKASSPSSEILHLLGTHKLAIVSCFFLVLFLTLWRNSGTFATHPKILIHEVEMPFGTHPNGLVPKPEMPAVQEENTGEKVFIKSDPAEVDLVYLARKIENLEKDVQMIRNSVNEILKLMKNDEDQEL